MNSDYCKLARNFKVDPDTRIGRKQGIATVVSAVRNSATNGMIYAWKCDCGAEFERVYTSRIQSCGCAGYAAKKKREAAKRAETAPKRQRKPKYKPKSCSECKYDVTYAEQLAGKVCKIEPTEDKNGVCQCFKPNGIYATRNEAIKRTAEKPLDKKTEDAILKAIKSGASSNSIKEKYGISISRIKRMGAGK